VFLIIKTSAFRWNNNCVINETISPAINPLDMPGLSDLFAEIRLWWSEMQYPNN
jgi:hypothetical protein